MHWLMIANAIFTICLIGVLADGARYRGGYAPGSGSLHSIGIAFFGGAALLSWLAATAAYWINNL
jgi:hypothetical protein